MDHSRQQEVMGRRRGLHFDAEASDRPLVTRPGRSRGHLHRVDPYYDNAHRRSSGQPSPNIPISASITVSSGDGSTTSSTRRSSLGTRSTTSRTPALDAGLKRMRGKAKNSATSSTRSFSRSVTWSNAINVGQGSNGIGIGIGAINHHHPLGKDVLPTTSVSVGTSARALARQKGLGAAVQYTLRYQGRRLSTAISSRQRNLSFTTFHKMMIFLVPILLISYSPGKKHVSKNMDKMTKMPQFQWSPNRRLNNRGCVLNMFIDKQEPDEFNPDYKKIKPGEKNKDGTPKLPTPPKLEKGSYRTEGQVKVIMRFISSIADSFRPILDMQQHVVFTGARDGGHLADQALKMWPPRGKYRTKLYVIADDEDAPSMSERDHSDRALQYGPIDAIEQRFQNHKYSQYIHVFDSKGQKAGLVNSYVDDDDVAQIMEEEMFHLEDDEFGPDISSVDDDTVMDTNSLDGKVTGTDFFSLKKLMNPYLERGEDEEREFLAERLEAVNRTNHAIPYFHVDGTSQLRQFDVLQSAKPLILDKTISVVGVENTPDTDFDELIDFFHTVNMKTFLLGKSQIMRIDHLCRETLDDLIAHPNITPKRPGPIRRLLQRLKFIPPDPLAHVVHPHPNNDLLFPPFFVALPRGRTSKEEMTIQHMYDLFGGGGGGGQIATANDRKAPDKKKKKT